jgi:hypothetical protein
MGGLIRRHFGSVYERGPGGSSESYRDVRLLMVMGAVARGRILRLGDPPGYATV